MPRASVDTRGHDITIQTHSSIPAGWYPDPGGTAGKRWWDGVQWTTHLQAPAPVAPPAVEQRPYIPMQSSSLPAVQMGQVHQTNDRAAIGSVVIGAIAFCLSIVGFLPGSPVFYYSAGGVFAVIGGIRALSRRQSGFGTTIWAPVLAIVLGTLAVIFMITGIVIHETVNAAYLGSSSLQQNGTGGDVSSTATLPVAPAFVADPTLTTYEQSAAAVAQSIDANYNHGLAMSATPNWPASLTLSDGQVTFPGGSVATVLPADEAMKYVVSEDGKYFDLSISGGNLSEIAIYDSESNSFTWACETGALVTCPSGGLPPSSGSSSTGSNA